MAIQTLSINYICSTDRIHAVSMHVLSNGQPTDIMLFTTELEDDDIFYPLKFNCNKTSLYDNQNDEIFHNMYYSDDPYFKSPIYKNIVNGITPSTFDFLNTFLHSLGNSIDNAFQIDNVIYGILPESIYGHADIECDSYQYLSIDNGNSVLPNKIVKTNIYMRDVISALVNGISSRQDLKTDEEILSSFNGVAYSGICEIPGNIYNDYDSGNLAINTFKTKNLYDSTFNMSHDDTYVLKNCRTYIDMNHNNSLVYLKYYDNVDYLIDNRLEKDKNISVIKSSSDSSEKYNLKLLHIEQISQISRYTAASMHNTTLYSVNINTDIFKNLNIPELALATIKNELASNVKKILKNLAPAQAQVFDIQINDI